MFIKPILTESHPSIVLGRRLKPRPNTKHEPHLAIFASCVVEFQQTNRCVDSDTNTSRGVQVHLFPSVYGIGHVYESSHADDVPHRDNILNSPRQQLFTMSPTERVSPQRSRTTNSEVCKFRDRST